MQQLIAGSPVVQHPIGPQLQLDSRQPVTQRLEPIIHQQYIANSQDREFESEVLASGVSTKSEDDSIEDKISANVEDEEAPSELLISKKSEELKSTDSGVQLLTKEPVRQDRHEEKLDFEKSSAEELAIKQKLVRVGNKEIHSDSLVLEELNKIPIDEPSGDYRYEYFQGKNSRYNKECRRHGSMYRLVGENLGKYIILTGKANIVILTKVLAVIFTEYNRGFCLNLWDPGGRSCECSSDHQPIILFLFQFIDYRLVTYAY